MIKFPAVHIDFERGRETSTRGEGDFTFKSFGKKKEIYGGVSFLKEPESIKEKKHTHTGVVLKMRAQASQRNNRFCVGNAYYGVCPGCGGSSFWLGHTLICKAVGVTDRKETSNTHTHTHSQL